MSSPEGTAPSDLNAQAAKLAAEIELVVSQGDAAGVSQDTIQDLMAALAKAYSAKIDAGGDFLPLRSRLSVNNTEVMTTASALLKATNLAVFELGMWQSFTGR